MLLERSAPQYDIGYQRAESSRKFRAYARVKLLCIDEIGYLSYDSDAADLLYEVVNSRYMVTCDKRCGGAFRAKEFREKQKRAAKRKKR